MKNKKSNITKIFYLSCFLVLVLFASSCFLKDVLPAGTDSSGTDAADNVSKNIEELSEIDILLKNEDFLETFNTFFYPESEVTEAKVVDSEQNLLFFILESDDNFNNVENYYKEKKVQSIWSRDLIFEKSRDKESDESEGVFEEESTYIPVTKFTYSSKDKDKIVDVVIKQLNDTRTQIMITYWNLHP